MQHDVTVLNTYSKEKTSSFKDLSFFVSGFQARQYEHNVQRSDYINLIEDIYRYYQQSSNKCWPQSIKRQWFKMTLREEWRILSRILKLLPDSKILWPCRSWLRAQKSMVFSAINRYEVLWDSCIFRSNLSDNFDAEQWYKVWLRVYTKEFESFWQCSRNKALWEKTLTSVIHFNNGAS